MVLINNAETILIVENKTIFEEVLRRGLYERKDCAVVYSEGYLSSGDKHLLQNLKVDNPILIKLMEAMEKNDRKVEQEILLDILTNEQILCFDNKEK
ncbi:hypothetical protein L9W92_16080 [Pelotomaculum terephthalicicum JT]|uniref:hypothetical protein n=1 Tax=Pelotomaculum TaxID=191373 RepID=UPI0009CA13DF|nr:MULTISPECIES: hypothetical protein [Pelotomaculum]MCG9969524.1 hypothetical protein [Pelotomaculum terephthalicicum JT]OPX84878.1 MAG: hypothetical protein A4E54_02721 [Pelotomaculum sp. PtaB.Bin117]OPY61887.1 MAG: hypothetical protein A4E56_01765 [Pelotomaculum sp. PtaU1.Bin065]